MPILLRDIKVHYERWGQSHSALDGLNLEIPNGQWLLVTGHNGSGKSTLLNVLAGHVQPASGQVELGGRDGSLFQSDMYFVRQDPLVGTAENLTLEENLTVALTATEHRQHTNSARRNRITACLNSLDLANRARQLMRDFSGGERQQVSLLIASLRRPRLLLLDEPFSALDPSHAASALELIRNMHATGTNIVQVTHDQAFVAKLGLRTLVLERGRIIEDTPPSAGADGESIVV